MEGKRLAVPYQQQMELKWCWAACGAMLSDYFSAHRSQCEVAALALGSDCCQSPGVCDEMATDVAIEALYQRLHLPNQGVARALRLKEVIEDLGADRPVQVFWSGDYGGHTALIVGWQHIAGQFFLDVLDPDPSVRHVRATFDDVLSANGSGRWHFSWRFL